MQDGARRPALAYVPGVLPATEPLCPSAEPAGSQPQRVVALPAPHPCVGPCALTPPLHHARRSWLGLTLPCWSCPASSSPIRWTRSTPQRPRTRSRRSRRPRPRPSCPCLPRGRRGWRAWRPRCAPWRAFEAMAAATAARQWFQLDLAWPPRQRPPVQPVGPMACLMQRAESVRLQNSSFTMRTAQGKLLRGGMGCMGPSPGGGAQSAGRHEVMGGCRAHANASGSACGRAPQRRAAPWEALTIEGRPPQAAARA